MRGIFRAAAAGAIAAALAGPGLAQEAGSPSEGTDTQEPVERAARGEPAPDPLPPTPTQPSAPAFVDELGRALGAPQSYSEAAYDSRLRASFLSAQGMKGPLEGAWTLQAAGGGGLYHLQLIDNSAGYLEGAWRDLRRPGVIDASGLIASGQRVGGQLSFRFYRKGDAQPVTADLTATADGRWSGEMVEEGQRYAVELRRD